jgi:fatty-acyl-CoA synthase/long-chain acyl-CoA synthetase
MAYAGIEDRKAIEAEGPYEDRDLPKTLHQMLSKTAAKFPNHNAVSYQIFSGPKDKAETLTWSQMLARTNQAANLFRSLGVGPNDVVAYVLPNCNETIFTLLGGAVAGIVNPINPLLEPEQIGSILRETNAKVVVTLRPFPKTDVAQKVSEAVRHAPNVKTVLEVDLNRYVTPPKSWIVSMIRPKLEGERHADYKNFTAEMKKQPETLQFEDPAEDRVAFYFHTGGTTGMPKVAQHRYSGVVYTAGSARLCCWTKTTTFCVRFRCSM